MSKVQIKSKAKETPKKITKLQLGDFYKSDHAIYIVGVEATPGKSTNVLYGLHDGCRASNEQWCLDNVNNGRFVKLEPGTVIEIVVE